MFIDFYTRTSKLLLLALALACFLLIPLLLPSELDVVREIKIQTTQANAYSYLVNLETWKEWSPWLEKEPSASSDFFGIPGVVGSYTEWKGKKIGSGRQTLIELNEPLSIKTQLDFYEPFKSSAVGYIKLDDYGENVLVKWGMNMTLDYPLGRYFGLFVEDNLGPDFNKGLQNLKSKLEATP